MCIEYSGPIILGNEFLMLGCATTFQTWGQLNSGIDYLKKIELRKLELKFPTTKKLFTIFTRLTLTCGVINILEPKWSRLICFSWRSPRLLLIQHSLYVGVIEKSSPTTPLTGEQYGKITWGWSLPECFTCSGGSTSPFILNNSVETAAPFDVVTHPWCCKPRN